MHTSCMTAIYLCSDDFDSIANIFDDPSLVRFFALVFCMPGALRPGASQDSVRLALVAATLSCGWVHAFLSLAFVAFCASDPKGFDLDHP